MPLPYEIEFGDSLEDVFEIFGIELDPYSDFTPDKNSDTDMTIYSDDTSILTFQNLKRTKEPVDFEFPYVLTYTESYEIEQKGKKKTTVSRIIRLNFDDSDKNALGLLEISVTETRELG